MKKGKRTLSKSAEKQLMYAKVYGEEMKHDYYYYEDDIWIDENGNERGDSIDLSPASYELDIAGTFDWEKIFEEEIQMQVYEEGMYD